MSPPSRLAAALLLLLATVAGARSAPNVPADTPAATATAQGLCDALIAAMKKGPSMGFAERRDMLAPEIQRDFDLGFMTRIVVGPPWRALSPEDQGLLVDAFSAYSIATYAQRFKSYSGERFEVDPSPTPLPKGDCVVHTKLFTGDPKPVQLDYLMRMTGGQWKIIDVFLSGTISEMAARRSEYSTVFREGGAKALISLLTVKAADLGGQRPGSS